MIAWLEGILRDKSPTRIVLDVHGVGYELFVPFSTSENTNNPFTIAWRRRRFGETEEFEEEDVEVDEEEGEDAQPIRGIGEH